MHQARPRAAVITAVSAALTAWILAWLPACSSPEKPDAPEAAAAASAPGDAASPAAPPEPPRGVLASTDAAAPGFVLFSPLSSGTTYLLDRDARIVHTWESEYAPHSLYLLDDGSLLRPGRDPDNKNFMTGGAMGILQKFTWDGELVWEWKLSDERRILHHDVEPLPNGNLLAIGFESKTKEEGRQAGRRADLIPEEGLWPDFLLEIEPRPPRDARIVWEWHVWDHLIQDHDKDAASYGDPAQHPERIDVNGGGAPLEIDDEQLAELKALGYVPEEAEPRELRSDFLHVNAIDWHPGLDQIAVAVPEMGEIWILKRPRSSEEAAGPAGDLLYRWGNPAMYRHGRKADQQLFYPHDVQWTPEGWAGAGHLTIFNNGGGRPAGKWSSVEEIGPPLGGDGGVQVEADRYARLPGEPWGPAAPIWTYTAPERESFFAPFISGAHRLPNGNNFVTSGPQGRLFEVTPAGEIVWELWNPYKAALTMRDGSPLWGRGGDEFAYAIWRAAKLPPDHPGLAGRDLRPLN